MGSGTDKILGKLLKVSNGDLTQLEANKLIEMPKYYQNEQRRYTYPSLGEIIIPLLSVDEKEEFLLDVWKGTIGLKSKHQMRGRKVVILVRLDLHGAPHRNPDGEEVSKTHIHFYREGYGDKWAYPVDLGIFPNLNDLWQTLHDFMNFCNIQKMPIIDKGLF